MKIAIDLDGVTVDFMGHWRRIYRTEFGTTPTDEHDDGYHRLSQGTHFEDETAWWKWYHDRIAFQDVDIMPGARIAIGSLMSSQQVVFVTARPTYGWQASIDQVRKMWPHHKAPVLFSYPFVTKVAMASHIGFEPDIWIDDSPNELHDMLNSHRWHTIIYDQPWNRRISGCRYDDWVEIVYHIHERNRK